MIAITRSRSAHKLAALLVAAAALIAAGWLIIERGDDPQPIKAPNNAMTHAPRFVLTAGDRHIAVRDLAGRPLVGDGDEALTAGYVYSGCPGSDRRCVRVQGQEAIATPGGQTLYYQWASTGPHAGGGDGAQGFVAAKDLAGTPQLDASTSNGNGAPQALYPGRPQYRVTPVAIDRAQGYVGATDGQAHTFAPYGLASSPPAGYTLLTWNLTDVGGGGIARAAISGGMSFWAASDAVKLTSRPVDYDPVTRRYSLAPAADGRARGDGSITWLYGRVTNGAAQVFGWIVSSHRSPDGACIDHMQLISGPAVPGAGCPSGGRGVS